MILFELNKVDSTNSWAKRNLSKCTEPMCVTAKEQSLGKGRYGHQWISPKGQLYVTWAEPIDLPLSGYVQSSCLAVYELVAKYGVSATIKWPNDILVNKKKIAGILIEEYKGWAIIGIGINITENTCIHVLPTAISLHQVCSDCPTVQQMQTNLIRMLGITLKQTKKYPLHCYLRWKQKVDWIIGSEICTHTAKEKKITGIVKDIDMQGNIVVQLPDRSLILSATP